jgi:protein associated with RNAse G/E
MEWIEGYLKDLKVDENTKKAILERYSELKNSTRDGEWLQNISTNVVNKIDLINQWIEEAKQAQSESKKTLSFFWSAL